jgi:RHS repeat-associated protein
MKELITADMFDTPNREYHPTQGRWITPDPAGLSAADPTNPQSWNRYAYVLNNPLSYKDPTGLWCVWEDGTHDDDPSEGGASSGDCTSQGGHWDSFDTITGIFQQNGNVTQINYIGGGTCTSADCGAGGSLQQFDQTLQSYSVLPNNNGNSLPGFTFQLGVALNWNIYGPFAGSGFSGLAIDSHGHIATYWGGGAGLAQGAGVSGGVQLAGSNGNSVCALGGPFTNVSGTAGYELAGTGDYFQGAGDAPGGTVKGGGVTLGVGAGGAASIQETGTSVHPFGHTCVNGKIQ